MTSNIANSVDRRLPEDLEEIILVLYPHGPLLECIVDFIPGSGFRTSVKA
jgi:hypothetical protein